MTGLFIRIARIRSSELLKSIAPQNRFLSVGNRDARSNLLTPSRAAAWIQARAKSSSSDNSIDTQGFLMGLSPAHRVTIHFTPVATRFRHQNQARGESSFYREF
jgi:hypothetical protein